MVVVQVGEASESSTGSWLRRRWWLLAIPVLLAAAILLPPMFNANRFRKQITETLSTSLNRPVRVDSVTLRLLPTPAFVLENFEVGEDPAFGAEPVLRAASVTATLRASSLWRRQLEISSISLDAPSLNLVRGASGKWNFDDTLLAAARIPGDATGAMAEAPRTNRRPAFPYIEATNARINFKSGIEKLPFSFEEADLALWLDTPQEWRLRFKAQPIRTDLTSSDAGLLRVEGSFRRAATLDDTAIKLDARWDHAQLGELSRLLTGQDAGWRGGLEVRLQAAGMAAAPLLSSRIRVTDFRRAEFVPAHRLDFESNCKASYMRAAKTLNGIDCLTPLGEGGLHLTGSVADAAGTSAVEIALDKVPAETVLETLRHIEPGIPEDWRVRGSADGAFAVHREPEGGWVADGQAAMERLILDVPGGADPVVLMPLRVETAGLATAGLAAAVPARAVQASHERGVQGHGRRPKQPAAALESDDGFLLQMAPAAIAGTSGAGSSGAGVSAKMSRKGYEIRLAGGMPVARLLQLRGAIPLPGNWLGALKPAGTADLDLVLRGKWGRQVGTDGTTVAPAITGTVKLHNAVLDGGRLPAPVNVSAVRISLGSVFGGSDGGQGGVDSGMVRWDGLTASYAGVPFEGSFWFPAACPAATECVRHFDLRARSIAGAKVAALVKGAPDANWMTALLRKVKSNSAPWPRMEGNLHVGAVSVGDGTPNEPVLRGLQAAVKIEGRRVDVTSLDGQAFGGNLTADGVIDLAGENTAYTVHARLSHASAEAVSAVAGQAPVLIGGERGVPADPAKPVEGGEGDDAGGISGKLAGIVDAQLSVRATGATVDEVRRSAAGSYSFDWRHGGLGGIAVGKAEDVPAQRNPMGEFDRWTAQGAVADGKLMLGQSKLAERGRTLPVAGSIGLNGQIDLKTGELKTGEPVVHIVGTLLKPVANGSGGEEKTAAVRP